MPAMPWEAGSALQSAERTILTTFRPGHEEFNMVVLPIVAYWAVAGLYELLDRCQHPSVARYRVTRANPGRANTVTRGQVLVRVLLQQLLQTLLGGGYLVADPGHCQRIVPAASPAHAALQLLLGMLIMDTWQYWIHRWVHVSPFLYKHLHSTHHRLYITYAMGALYNHPLEALLLDTLGAGISAELSGMSCGMATWFFTFATLKTVFDHSSYRFPLNPVHPLFPNSAAYHDVHHDVRGIKANFSQPFFTWWDHLCGTYLDPAQFHLTQQQIDAKLGLGSGKSAAAGQQGAKNEEEEGRQRGEATAAAGKGDGARKAAALKAHALVGEGAGDLLVHEVGGGGSPAGSHDGAGSTNLLLGGGGVPEGAGKGATSPAARGGPASGGVTTRSRARQQQQQP